MPPSFRNARKSLTKKFRLFKRRTSRQRALPIVTSTGNSLNSHTSVLISPSGIEAEVIIGNEDENGVTPVIEIKGNTESVQSPNLEYEGKDQYPPIITPVVSGKETNGAADISVSLKGNEIVAVGSVAEVDIVNEGKKGTTENAEPIKLEYEEIDQYIPTCVPIVSAEETDNETAEEEKFEEMEPFDMSIIIDAEKENAAATEITKTTNAAAQVGGSNDGDCDEHTQIIRTSSPSSNKNTPSTRQFEVGDHVQVVKKGHAKNGMSGIIERQIKCYVFFTQDSKKNQNSK